MVYVLTKYKKSIIFNPTKKMKIKKSDFIEKLIASGEITINPELDKYDGISLFPEKVRKGKEILAKGKLPQAYYDQMAKKNEENKK